MQMSQAWYLHQMDATDPFLSSAEVAERLGTTDAVLRTWRYRKVFLPYVKIGGRCVYRTSDVEAYLAANTHQPAARA